MRPCGKDACGPCSLCQRTSSRYCHLSTLKSKGLADCIKSNNSEVKETDCICNACRIKYSNKLKDLSYTPKKTRKKDRLEHCFLSSISLCSELSQVDSCIPLTDFNESFNTELQSVPDPVPLCQKHRAQISNFHKLKE